MDYNFDRVADKYDATRGLPPGVAERVCRWVLSRLPADPGIAEIGVGTGRMALPFIEGDVRFAGFDISEQMLARLNEKLGGNLRRAQLYMADITQPLPVPPGSQDAVLAAHILHLVDSAAALEQVRRILKPHGALLWGYNMYDQFTPAGVIRPRYSQAVLDLGGPTRRDFHVQQARNLLAEWGTRVSQHTVAAWTERETPREVLTELRERIHSFTWTVPDDIHAAAFRSAEEWTLAEMGDLDRAYAYDVRFVIDWYQF